MNSEYGELINLDELHYASVTADTSSAYTAGANAYLAPAGEIKHEAKADINTRYYDGKPMFTSVTEGATTVTLTVSGVPMRLAAELTGKPYDDSKGIMIDTGDASATPDFALSGRMELGDGGYRYFQYLKGKFSVGAQEAQTKEDKTTVKTIDLTYTALATVYKFTMPDTTEKSIKGVTADTTDAAFTSADGWFDQVQTPDTIGAPSALSMSSIVPADEAASVAVDSTVVLTFSNKIASESITVISAAGVLVSSVKSYDSTGKILTITPAASLSAGTAYIVSIAGVTDIYGQTLADSATNFTTAA